MPDISLLQREPYEVEEEESRLPSIVFTFALIVLMVSVGAYVGLYLYNRFLISETEAFSEKARELNVGDVIKTVKELESVGNHAKSLKVLRETHTYPSRMFTNLERSTHLLAYFTAADVDVMKGSMRLQGIIPTPILLARQVELLTRDERIADFTVEDVGYGEKRQVRFAVTLNFKR